jgi:hypothetical protein
MSKEMDEAIDKFYEKTIKGTFEGLLNLIEEQIDNPDKEILEEKESRFSYSIAIPKLVPTEAWGEPSQQSRKEINRIFSVITGGADMQKRIADINKFLDPASARRKKSANVILNMMMIVEALQATLNDYNESSAGFVFEGFMAALTGGKQISGRVRGTLPIEDFVAFSEIGDGDPVSLKLLGPNTDTHGSFTNLVDYLFVRGKEKITYLIAYKLVVGEKVERLQLFDFKIKRDNLVDVMLGSNNMGVLGSPKAAKNLKVAIANWDGEQGESLRAIALALKDMPGYTNKGMMHGMAHGGEAYNPPEDEPEDQDLSRAGLKKREKIKKIENDIERITKLLGPYGKLTTYDSGMSKEEIKAKKSELKAQLAAKQQELAGLVGQEEPLAEQSFHQMEKKMMSEELLLEGTDSKSQWGISRNQMDSMKGLIEMQNYGELNLSQKNIDELVEIYSEILGDSLRKLLEGTEKLTKNIGRYYTESKRARAMAANNKGQDTAKEVVDLLVENPKYDKKEKSD